MNLVNTDAKVDLINKAIRDVPDFPKPGIVFKDITTLLSDHEAFKACIDLFYDKYKDADIDFIAGPESRGFIFAAPLAQRIGAGLTLIRKPGKLPAKTIEYSYELEYGSDTLCIHEDAFANCKKEKANVLIVDDLLATGGSAFASMELIEKAGANVVAAAFVIELGFLNGQEKLSKTDVFSILKI